MVTYRVCTMAMGAAHTCTWLYGLALEKVVILKQPEHWPLG